MNIRPSLTGGKIVNNASENPSNVNISAPNGNIMVNINTSSKKIEEYMKQHFMNEHSIDSCSDNTTQSKLHLENRKKKTPQRITDVDALFEGNLI